MLKKEVTYKDFDGKECTDTLYFNLTSMEIMKFDRKYEGGFSKKIEEITSSEDAYGMFAVVEDLVLASYGERVERNRFAKSEKIAEEFAQTIACEKLITDLVRNPDEMTAFVNGIIPSELLSEVQASQKKLTAE